MRTSIGGEAFSRVGRSAHGADGAEFPAVERPGGRGECWCGWYVPSPLTLGRPAFHDARHSAWRAGADPEAVREWMAAADALAAASRADGEPRPGTLRAAVLAALREGGEAGLSVADVWTRARAAGGETRSAKPHLQVADALYRLAHASPPLARRAENGLWTHL